MSTEIISDAEIAGYMNWRGPGAYTQHSLRKIKRIVEEVQHRMTEQPVSQEPVAIADGTFNHNCPLGTPLYTAPQPVSQDAFAASGKPMVDHPGNPTDMVDQIADCLVEDHIALMNENEELRRALGAKQAEIDRLMLEYCPSEMTPEQIAEWGANQKPITEAWHGQSNINSRFNACQHKEYCVQLLERVTHKTGEPK